MDGVLLGLFGGAIAGLATIVGSIPLFFNGVYTRKILDHIKFDFFLGLMLTASFLGLLLPAFRENKLHSPTLLSLSILLGAGFVLLTRKLFSLFFEKLDRKKTNEEFRAIIFVLAIVIQNIPEGLAAGATMTLPSFMQALSLIGVIALQDLTEGMTTGLSLFSLGLNKKQVFLGVALTGIIEGMFGVVGGYLSSTILGVMPLILAFAGGAMLAVTTGEVFERVKSSDIKFLVSPNFVSGIMIMVTFNLIHP